MESIQNLIGTFDENASKAITSALSKLIKVGVQKIVLDFKKNEADKYILNISTKNSNSTIMSIVSFDVDLLNSCKIESEFKYGISDLPNFLSILQIFKNGFNISMTPVLAIFEYDDSIINYYGADTSKIQVGQSGSEIKSQILATLTCDDSFKDFFTAASKLDQNQHIIFRGNAEEGSLNISVADKDVRGNNFVKKIKTHIDSDFKIVVHKEYFVNILVKDTVAILYKHVLHLKCKEKLYDINYYILPIK
jgi:hypothetical protein